MIFRLRSTGKATVLALNVALFIDDNADAQIFTHDKSFLKVATKQNAWSQPINGLATAGSQNDTTGNKMPMIVLVCQFDSLNIEFKLLNQTQVTHNRTVLSIEFSQIKLEMMTVKSFDFNAFYITPTVFESGGTKVPFLRLHGLPNYGKLF